MNAVVPSGVGDHIGLAVVRSLGAKKIHTTVTSNSINALPFYSKYCSQKIISGYTDELLSSFTEEDIIMPNGEDEMLFFAKNAPLYDYHIAYPEYSTLQKIIDKGKFMQCALSHNIPAPNTFFPKCPEDIEQLQGILDYPVVIKPNRGKGGRGILRVDNPEILENAYGDTFQQFGPSIIQEYIPFQKRYSAAVLLNKVSQIQGICILQEIRTYPIRSGPGCFVKTVQQDEIMNSTIDILNKLKYRGVVELDFVIDERDGKPKLLEINPRFWSSLQCAITSGVDFPYLLYQMANGTAIDGFHAYKPGIHSRNVISNDARHLLSVLRGTSTSNEKARTIIDFMKFYQDDDYFIFSFSDIGPFTSVFRHYLGKMMHRFVF